MKEYLSEISQVMENLNTCKNGLSAEDVALRLNENGLNRLREGKKDSVIKRFFKQMADPMIIILIIAAVISGITAAYSHESFADVIIILFVVIINSALGVFQETKAEKAIAALQEIAAATSKVIRDGKQLTVRSEELVPGDIIILEAGDSVPADARIIECASMKIEEAALTGESVPVDKLIDVLNLRGEKDIPLGDRKNMVYMGSTVVYGRGKAVVTNTGMSTEIGKIADALASAKDEQTPLQKKLTQLSKILSIMVLGICVLIFAVSLIRVGKGINLPIILDTFMIAVSLAVAAIPEGLAAVVTIVLSIGVTNMSKRNAVIRKLTAVETLGCTQIICSDKTGTLTQNKMTVVEHSSSDEKLLAMGMALCCDAELDENNEAIGEPTECALVNDSFKLGTADYEKEYTRISEAPFDSSRKMMSVVCRHQSGRMIQFTKGAPDEVLKLCTHYWNGKESIPMNDKLKQEIFTSNKSMADSALRVLCGAMRNWDENPDSSDPSFLEQDLCFIGLSGMIDPIRPEVKVAIDECRHAGITPIMITGDHIDTASAIAKQLGILDEQHSAITGAQLNEISEDELNQNISKYTVYARVQPEHKVRIVNAWRTNNHITAMTGDGVNDAPSIKNADIGIGMGITGTDVTKNVADMVLADDNFATIVAAVEEGRKIYDNIRKSIQFLLSSNLAEVISIFAATLIGFVILKPVHLLWINLITDCFPALALGMEKSESNIMDKPPRNPDEGIFSGGMGFDIVFQGFIIAGLTLLSYFIGHYLEAGVWEAATSADGMTMAFLTLSLVEIFHSFNMRSRRESLFSLKKPNKWLLASMVVSLLLTISVIFVPFLASAFGFETISLKEFAVALGLSVSIIPIMEIIKFIQRRLGKS